MGRTFRQGDKVMQVKNDYDKDVFNGDAGRILSLGAGVQSTTVLLMSIAGELPKIDHAIFADTGWEPTAVYEHLDWLEGWAIAAGVKIHRVSNGNIRDDAITRYKLLEQRVGGVDNVDAVYATTPRLRIYHT